MYTKTVGSIVLFVFGWGAMLSGVQDQTPMEKNTAKFMARKLDGSRDIVAGLATENFDLISQSAQNLMLLSHEADWNVIQTEPYLRMSSEFRRSAERLRDSANEDNLDGATLAYFEVTLNCVRCHKYIRDRHGEPLSQ
jgi:hypothetical protein